MTGALRFAGYAWIVLGAIAALLNIIAIAGARGLDFAGIITLIITPVGLIFTGFLALGVAYCIELLEEVRFTQREIQRKLNG